MLLTIAMSERVIREIIFYFIQRGNTGLHLAVRNENIDVVVLLIENGADVNIKNNVMTLYSY